MSPELKETLEHCAKSIEQCNQGIRPDVQRPWLIGGATRPVSEWNSVARELKALIKSLGEKAVERPLIDATVNIRYLDELLKLVEDLIAKGPNDETGYYLRGNKQAIELMQTQLIEVRNKLRTCSVQPPSENKTNKRPCKRNLLRDNESDIPYTDYSI